jgi:hypothetical protein
MKLVLATLVAAAALPAAAEITLYSREAFDGRYITFTDGERNLNRENFNDRASSAIVRGGRYEVCEDADFRGRCVVLRPGQYPSLTSMGIGDAVSSVRPVAATSPTRTTATPRRPATRTTTASARASASTRPT